MYEATELPRYFRRSIELFSRCRHASTIVRAFRHRCHWLTIGQTLLGVDDRSPVPHASGSGAPLWFFQVSILFDRQPSLQFYDLHTSARWILFTRHRVRILRKGLVKSGSQWVANRAVLRPALRETDSVLLGCKVAWKQLSIMNVGFSSM